MNFYEVFDTIKEEFDEDTALLCVCAMSVLLSTTPTNYDLEGRGRFTTKVYKKVSELLWEHEDGKVEEVLKIIDAYHDFEMGKSMKGLGGCVEKTLKEIIANKKQ